MIYKAFGVLLLAMTLLLTNRAIAGGGGTQTTQTTLNLGIVTTNPFSACVTYLSAEHCVNLTFSATGAFSDEHTNYEHNVHHYRPDEQDDVHHYNERPSSERGKDVWNQQLLRAC
jgi:hypothetical protein